MTGRHGRGVPLGVYCWDSLGVTMSERDRPGFLTLCLLFLAVSTGAHGAAPAPSPSPAPTAVAGPVPVHISGIRMMGPEQVLLLLADESEEHAVPISVGREQGIAI